MIGSGVNSIVGRLDVKIGVMDRISLLALVLALALAVAGASASDDSHYPGKLFERKLADDGSGLFKDGQHAGYYHLNDTYAAKLFYYFFESRVRYVEITVDREHMFRFQSYLN